MNFVSFILEFWNQNWSDILLFGLTFLIFVFKLISSRVKNEKLKRLFDILPECMRIAEENGGSSEDKLNRAVLEIKNRLKGLKESYIKTVIENAIKISKECNSKDNVRVESRITRS